MRNAPYGKPIVVGHKCLTEMAVVIVNAARRGINFP